MRHKDGLRLYACTKAQCWIPDLLSKDFLNIWPIQCSTEPRLGDPQSNKYYKWNFNINWTEQRHTRVNGVWLCEKHHKLMLGMMEEEMAYDVAEQEATDRWAIQNRGRL